MADQIEVVGSGGLVEITINRPERKNAINNEMYDHLTLALMEANADPAVRCVLITGAGDAFCAGNDVKEFISAPPITEDAPVFKFLKALTEHEKILIAAVNGLAVGIGATMLLHCDLVLAVEKATFQLPFLTLAIVPEAASSLLLPRLIGHQRTMELLLLGKPIDAQTAKDYGWINRIQTPDELMPVARDLAAQILEKPPEALKLVKRLVRSDSQTVAARLHEENHLLGARLLTAEGKEAVNALIDKRKPRFGATQ